MILFNDCHDSAGGWCGSLALVAAAASCGGCYINSGVQGYGLRHSDFAAAVTSSLSGRRDDEARISAQDLCDEGVSLQLGPSCSLRATWNGQPLFVGDVPAREGALSIGPAQSCALALPSGDPVFLLVSGGRAVITGGVIRVWIHGALLQAHGADPEGRPIEFEWTGTRQGEGWPVQCAVPERR